MADWATEFAHEILESEGKTAETWSSLSDLLRKAVAEINGILEGKSQTKLTLSEGAQILTLDVNLGRKASFNLNAHARTMSLVLDRAIYNFQLTKEPRKMTSSSTPLLPGATANEPVDLALIASYAIKAVVDLRE